MSDTIDLLLTFSNVSPRSSAVAERIQLVSGVSAVVDLRVVENTHESCLVVCED